MATMAIGDISTGVATAMGICAALLHRERTGEGQYLEGSLLDTYFHMHDQHVPKIALAGNKVHPTREGAVPRAVGPLGIYRYRDNQYITILTTPHQWPQVLQAMNRPDLANDPRFSKPRARAINYLEL
jgi:CoA:oxalate CoA-transferase